MLSLEGPGFAYLEETWTEGSSISLYRMLTGPKTSTGIDLKFPAFHLEKSLDRSTEPRN